MTSAADKRHAPAWLIEGLRTALSAIVATAGASWTARGYLAEFDKRITVLEESHARLARDMVPRDEQRAHWDATERGLVDLKQDLREFRQELLARRGFAQQQP